MQAHLISKKKDFMQIQIDGDTSTLLIPLRNELLSDNAVSLANYNIRHPELDLPIFNIKVNSGKPQNALKKGCKSLSKQCRDFLAEFERQAEEVYDESARIPRPPQTFNKML